jgi:RNA polymerase sigma factor (TIGR02999 family)
MSDSNAVPQPLAAEAPSSPEQLLEQVYEELRKLAALRLSREAPGQTLQATALVHEAWLRLGGDRQPSWQSRAQFFAAAAEAMRRIVIDRARRRKALRRGGHSERVELEELEIAAAMDDDQLLATHEALDRLAQHDPAKAELVKLRFFVGLTLEEAAQVQGVSVPTAKRHWAYARAWLYREIGGEKPS